MKILTGLLHSPEGEAAIAAAVEEARERGGELHLVTFLKTPHDPQGSQRFSTDLQGVLDRAEAEAAPLRAEGLTVRVHAPRGSHAPSEAILQFAAEERVDLIVIGMRRRSRVSKMVLGSNAQDILLGADAAVLAVKPVHE
jgi:nucleotide-binding universal stress UspA family protein